jgi:hypothetical protein
MESTDIIIIFPIGLWSRIASAEKYIRQKRILGAASPAVEARVDRVSAFASATGCRRSRRLPGVGVRVGYRVSAFASEPPTPHRSGRRGRSTANRLTNEVTKGKRTTRNTAWMLAALNWSPLTLRPSRRSVNRHFPPILLKDTDRGQWLSQYLVVVAGKNQQIAARRAQRRVGDLPAARGQERCRTCRTRGRRSRTV